jgi:hypothetical protein
VTLPRRLVVAIDVDGVLNRQRFSFDLTPLARLLLLAANHADPDAWEFYLVTGNREGQWLDTFLMPFGAMFAVRARPWRHVVDTEEYAASKDEDLHLAAERDFMEKYHQWKKATYAELRADLVLEDDAQAAEDAWRGGHVDQVLHVRTPGLDPCPKCHGRRELPDLPECYGCRVAARAAQEAKTP